MEDLLKAVPLFKVPMRFSVDEVKMTIKWTRQYLFFHYVRHIIFPFYPIGFNHAGCDGFTDNMEANSYMFLREIVAWISSAQDYAEVITKYFGWGCTIIRDINA